MMDEDRTVVRKEQRWMLICTTKDSVAAAGTWTFQCWNEDEYLKVIKRFFNRNWQKLFIILSGCGKLKVFKIVCSSPHPCSWCWLPDWLCYCLDQEYQLVPYWLQLHRRHRPAPALAAAIPRRLLRYKVRCPPARWTRVSSEPVGVRRCRHVTRDTRDVTISSQNIIKWVKHVSPPSTRVCFFYLGPQATPLTQCHLLTKIITILYQPPHSLPVCVNLYHIIVANYITVWCWMLYVFMFQLLHIIRSYTRVLCII